MASADYEQATNDNEHNYNMNYVYLMIRATCETLSIQGIYVDILQSWRVNNERKQPRQYRR